MKIDTWKEPPKVRGISYNIPLEKDFFLSKCYLNTIVVIKKIQAQEKNEGYYNTLRFMKLTIDSDMRIMGIGFRTVPTLGSSLVLNTSIVTDLLLLENVNILQQLDDICSHFLEEIEEGYYKAKW